MCVCACYILYRKNLTSAYINMTIHETLSQLKTKALSDLQSALFYTVMALEFFRY